MCFVSRFERQHSLKWARNSNEKYFNKRRRNHAATNIAWNIRFVFPCIASAITIDNQQDATIFTYLL